MLTNLIDFADCNRQGRLGKLGMGMGMCAGVVVGMNLRDVKGGQSGCELEAELHRGG
jgi:hypothetical protein